MDTECITFPSNCETFLGSTVSFVVVFILWLLSPIFFLSQIKQSDTTAIKLFGSHLTVVFMAILYTELFFNIFEMQKPRFMTNVLTINNKPLNAKLQQFLVTFFFSFSFWFDFYLQEVAV